MIPKFFKEEMGETLEVYMNDIIFNSSEEEQHDNHLTIILRRVQQHNIRLNTTKSTFGVRVETFLGFYLMKIGIEANTNKCEGVIKMGAPTIKEEVL